MSEKCIKLFLPDNHVVNSLGIQPTFYNSEICNRISLFSLYRYTKWAGDEGKFNNVYYEPVIYKDKNAQINFEMSTPYQFLEKKVIKTIWENGSHIALPYNLKNISNAKLREILLYYSELLKYWNRLNRGNVFITANERFNDISFAFKQLQHFDKYKVEENTLPDNVIIIAARGITNFDNSIIASPYIDEVDYKSFLKNNKLTDFYQIDASKRFPIMEKMNHLYDNYQLYINEKVPQKWHLEVFSNTKLYYIILHFKG